MRNTGYYPSNEITKSPLPSAAKQGGHLEVLHECELVVKCITNNRMWWWSAPSGLHSLSLILSSLNWHANILKRLISSSSYFSLRVPLEEAFRLDWTHYSHRKCGQRLVRHRSLHFSFSLYWGPVTCSQSRGNISDSISAEETVWEIEMSYSWTISVRRLWTAESSAPNTANAVKFLEYGEAVEDVFLTGTATIAGSLSLFSVSQRWA